MLECLTKLLAVDIDPKTRQARTPKYVHENSVKQRTSINYKEDKAGTKEGKPHMFKQVMSHLRMLSFASMGIDSGIVMFYFKSFC